MVNGCGFPVAGRIYFFAFQLVVSQIFLNLFIAIVIDAYSGQSQMASLPVRQIDLDLFCEVWSYYDNDATGFIEVN